jgi:DNA invertase Pin-like site-specific DNA recombinase
MKRSSTADGYIRVSRRAGREGESFISPEVQRKKIAGWAKLHEVEIVTWWEEIDQSGAKLERPMFQQALARCEAGETGGIVVARLDRFARSAVDALSSIRRLNDAGARLVSVEDNFDGSTPMGRFAIGILILIAELELARIKSGWEIAVRQAVERGVHISARTPTGYKRTDEGRLIRDEPAASVVAKAFRKRAAGASWADLARLLEEREVYPPTGNKNWSKFGVSGLIKNPVYLGQARSGKVVKEGAYEPLVTRAEFDAAQSVKKSFFSSATALSPRRRCWAGLPAALVAGTHSRSPGIRSARPVPVTRSITALVATPRVPVARGQAFEPQFSMSMSKSACSRRSRTSMGCWHKRLRRRSRLRLQSARWRRQSTRSTCA